MLWSSRNDGSGRSGRSVVRGAVDEIYIKAKGEWMYLYRAVDKAGKTLDFYLSRKRDVAAAKDFLRKAMREQRTPTKITLDAYAASHQYGSRSEDHRRVGEENEGAE